MNLPVTFSSSVYPVCLPAPSTNPNQHAGDDAAVMGWGPTSNEISSNKLLIPIVYCFPN
jgi:hypothetical protein